MYKNENEVTNEHADNIITERTELSRKNDSGCDFLLPDYMGDIKRMLDYSAEVLPAGQFHAGDEVSFSGVVVYHVLYLDGENRLTEACFTSDFEIEERVDERFVSADIKSRVGTLAVRVGGPRKLIAKASVISDIYILEKVEIESFENRDNVVTKKKKIKYHTAGYFSSPECEYAEEVALLEGVSAEEVEEVMKRGYINISGITKDDSAVRVVGEISAVALLYVGGSEYLNVEGKIPLDITVDADACTNVCDLYADGTLSSLSVGISNKSSTADSSVGASIVFNASVEVDVRVDMEKECDIIVDAFCVSGTAEEKYRDVFYNEHLFTDNKCEHFDFSVPKEALCTEELSEIIYVDARLRTMGVRREGNQAVIDGELMFTAVCIGEENRGFVTIKHSESVCVKQMVEDGGDVELEYRLHASCPRALIEGDDIKFSADVMGIIRAARHVKASVLDSISVSEAHAASDDSVITIYYPDATDTLWSVAKKYAVSPTALAEGNMINISALSDGDNDVSLNGIKMLIIR